MTSAKDIKQMAESIRRSLTGEHYYDKKYGDLKVADLLLVLEDENYHDEETIIEACVSLDYGLIVGACFVASDHLKAGELTEEIGERRRKITEVLRKGEEK